MIKQVPYTSVKTEGFWKNRQKINTDVTIPKIYDRFKDTGRFDALKCKYEEGMPKPHIFWDSDCAKWIESAAYSLALSPDEELEAKTDELIDNIASAQLEDGYFNSYYIPCELENRFTNRDNHELYCLGHLTEAAIAYYQATGKDKLLNVVKKYIDLVEKLFVTEGSAAFSTPGHEEIELALIKMYELTGDEKYKNLCSFFINTRGTSKKDENTRSWVGSFYDQTSMPVRELTEATGHSVRALYLYSGMADLARVDGDEELKNACERLFDNIVNKRMYVTGGAGSAHFGESFTCDYDLPGEEAYAETCATIALVFFSHRMALIDMNSKYADAAETAMYNGVLSGVSLDGGSFFYVNPLEINIEKFNTKKNFHNSHEDLLTQRVEVFGCSCCPPNLSRIIASFGGYFYSYDDSTVYVHHFGAGKAEFNGCSVEQDTRYPNHGGVRFTVKGLKGKRFAVRIPGWCEYASLNGEKLPHEPVKGYLYLDVEEDEQIFDFYFDMPARFVACNPEVDGCNGKVCVAKGPVIYCAESVINGVKKLNTLSVDPTAPVGSEPDEETGALRLKVSGFEDRADDRLYMRYSADNRDKKEITLLPYFAFANHGESNMLVWLRVAER